MPASSGCVQKRRNQSDRSTRCGATVCVSSPATERRPPGSCSSELADPPLARRDLLVEAAERVGVERVVDDEEAALVERPELRLGDHRRRTVVVAPGEVGVPRVRRGVPCGPSRYRR